MSGTGAPPGLRLASYNIHRCAGADGRSDEQRIAAVLAELDADVIALQEVETRNADGLDLLQRFASALDMHAVAGPTLLSPATRYGNALLSRPPLRAVRHLDLAVPGCEPRGAVSATIGEGSDTLRICATHFGMRVAERAHQCARVCHHLERAPPEHHVLLGDLNLWWPWEPAARLLRGFFGRGHPGPRSFPARRPLLRLDRILVSRPDVRFRVRAHRSALARVASDHLPVIARLGPAETASGNALGID